MDTMVKVSDINISEGGRLAVLHESLETYNERDMKAIEHIYREFKAMPSQPGYYMMFEIPIDEHRRSLKFMKLD